MNFKSIYVTEVIDTSDLGFILIVLLFGGKSCVNYPSKVKEE